jgi:hypothetical protein
VGTILIHAGMNKTGSTSIQLWITENVDQLRAAGIQPVTARPDGERLVVEPWSEGTAKAFAVPTTFYRAGEGLPTEQRVVARQAVADRLHEDLAALADRYGAVLFTTEGHSRFFVRQDEQYFGSLDAVAADHEVRVALYVRPQHTYIESDWRQDGFCTTWKPSYFVRRRAAGLHYWPTLEFTRRAAPHVEVDMRPFVRDVLLGGDVVRDFVEGFLRLPDIDLHETRRANAGFSLEFVSMLSVAPPGRFWQAHLGSQRLNRMKTLTGGWEPPANERTAEARRILQQWCHEEFEDENLQLIADRGWPIDAFVPAVGPRDDEQQRRANLRTLDQLWQPTASVGELAVFHEALDRLLGDYSAMRRDGDVPDWVASTLPLSGRL